MSRFKKRLSSTTYVILIIITSIIFSVSICLKSYFTATNVPQLLYNILNINTTLDIKYLDGLITKVLKSTLIFNISFLFPIIIQTILKLDFKIKIKNKSLKIFPLSLKKYSLTIFTISIVVISFQLKVPTFIKNQLLTSNLYEEYYVPYNEENITFPTNKQNLIYIYIESLENSGFSIENGGTNLESYIPNLEKLALNNINFSNTSKLGGFKTINGTNWTAAGMVAQTSGIPIYIKTTNKNNKFLEGATSLGEILEKNGYKNYLSIGSDSKFGDREKYFKEHGNYTIYDYNYSLNNYEIPDNYYQWWGLEDEKLFSLSKKRLTEISKNNEPFNFTILTADTHFFDGFVSPGCPNKFNNHYANSYYCSDYLLNNFIMWIMNQDFYENTTLIIAGDHLTMREDFYSIPSNYERTVYNAFINSKATPTETKNRSFTAMDMFPTTLAALGAEIKGNRLALGTNLFSNEKTISEQLTNQKLNNELQKKSNYYKNNILNKEDKNG